MISTNYLILIIFGMFVVTYPVRLLPLAFFNRIQIPRVLRMWLSYVPVAIFASLLTQIFSDIIRGPSTLDIQLPLLISCIGAILITVKTKSIGWGMGLGFGLYILLEII